MNDRFAPWPVRRVAAGVAVGLALLWAAVAAAAELPTVSGTATYRERMALPPLAVFEATLEDVSRAGAPAELVGRFASAPAGQVPIPFAIPYDPTRIFPGRRYVVRARILVDDRPLFATTDAHLVLTQGAPDRVTLVLRRVAGGAPEGPVAAPGSSVPRKALRGMYRCCSCRRTASAARAGATS